MKQLIWKLILPLTIISFASITKWWYTLPVDAPDTLFLGFPFPFVGEGWGSSMSFQVLVLELIADFLIYFIFWFILVFCINKYLLKIKSFKIVTIPLWFISGTLIFFATYIASFPDVHFYFKQRDEMEIMETGYKFIWQHTERPDYYKYHPKKDWWWKCDGTYQVVCFLNKSIVLNSEGVEHD